MPLKMTMMFRKFIITLQISNYKLEESAVMVGSFNLSNYYKILSVIGFYPI